MKNRLLLLVMCAVMAVGMISCGNPAEPEEFTLTTDNVNDYITSIGKYEGLTIDVKRTEMTDELIQNYTEAFFAKQAESIKDWVADRGDTVKINYTGVFGGEEESTISGKTQDVVIGKNTHISGFEEALVGTVAGDHVEFTLTYPADYLDASLAGRDCSFSVDVVAVIPKLSDASVKALGSDVYSNEKEYRVFVRNTLETFTDSDYRAGVVKAVIKRVAANSVFKELPAGFIASCEDYIENLYGDTAAKYNVSVAEYLELCDTSLEIEAREYAKQQLVIYKIAVDRGLEVSDEELDKIAKEYVDYYDEYNDLAAFYAVNPKEELREKTMSKKVSDYILSVTNQ